MTATVAEALDTVRSAGEPDEARLEAVRGVTRLFRDRVGEIVDAATLAADETIRLTKGRIATVLSCEGALLAPPPEASDRASPEVVLGRLVDLCAHHHLMAGPLDPNVAFDVAIDALYANGDEPTLAAVAGNEQWFRDRLGEHSQRLVSALRGIDRRWWPVAERSVGVRLADGRVAMSARFDLQLGGGNSGRPRVVVELKSGARHRGIVEDARWYALVGALRDDDAPRVVLTVFTADGTVLVEPIRPESVHAAGLRTLDALGRIAGIAGGRTPGLTASARCSWCTARPACPAARGDGHRTDGSDRSDEREYVDDPDLEGEPW